MSAQAGGTQAERQRSIAGGRRRRRARQPVVWRLVPLAAAAVFFVALPAAGLIARAPWASLWSELSSHEVLTALRLSLLCSVTAAVVSLAFGIPLAWLLARVEFRGKAIIRALAILPMVLPPIAGGVALLFAFGRRGIFGQWLDQSLGVRLPFTVWAAIMAETFVAMPFVVLTTEAALRSMDRRLEEAASTLGAGRWQVFRRVTLPLIAPSIGASAVLAWARALGEFGATITFAGNLPGRTQTLPLAVFVALETRPQAAVAMSLVMLALSIGVLAALREKWFPAG